MPIILNIDTATENATISISQNDNVISFLSSNNQKDHASFLQPAIKQLLQLSNYSMDQLNAVSVTIGPGSYTGLRVGLASAKGLCYALNIPLITLGTFEVMALSVINYTKEPELHLYCPMIDARRMEVFTAVYDHNLNEIIAPCAIILEPETLDNLIQGKQIFFFGSGAKKFSNQSLNKNLKSSETTNLPQALAIFSLKKFQKKIFTDLTYSEPLYIK